MGQQQLLLLALGVLIVALAIVAGVRSFEKYQERANRESLQAEMLDLGHRMVYEKMKPEALGGGGGGRWTANLFQKAAPFEGEGQFVRSPYGTIAFRSQNHVGHLIGWPNGSTMRDVLTVYVFQRHDRGIIVEPGFDTWMGKKKWLVRQGLMNSDGTLKDK